MAARTGDRSAVPHLIEMLRSDDPAVRMAAIRALERLTGETLNYEHFAPEHERQKSIAAWERWYERHAAGPGNTPEESGARSP